MGIGKLRIRARKASAHNQCSSDMACHTIRKYVGPTHGFIKRNWVDTNGAGTATQPIRSDGCALEKAHKEVSDEPYYDNCNHRPRRNGKDFATE